MRYCTVLFLVFIIFGCSQPESEVIERPSQAVIKGDTTVNDYAEAFRVIKFDDYVQLDIIDPATDSVLYRYGIGERVPVSLVDIGSHFSKVAALSSTHVGMMRELDLEDKILGVSDKKYLCKKNTNEEWVNFGELGQSDPELYIKHQPSLIIYSGFKLDIPVLIKLRKIGIPAMVNYDWKETHPLGRAEWLKVFGILFNIEERANERFDEIQRDYMGQVKYIQNDSTSPTVFVGTLYGDVFNVPAGESYMAKMLADANVTYKYEGTKGTGSLNITLEEIITTNRSTDYWLNVAASSKAEVLNMNENFKMLSAFQKEKVYTYFSKVNCFWEESAAAPEKVLSDLIHIFHSDQFENESLYYYESIDQD